VVHRSAQQATFRRALPKNDQIKSIANYGTRCIPPALPLFDPMVAPDGIAVRACITLQVIFALLGFNLVTQKRGGLKCAALE